MKEQSELNLEGFGRHYRIEITTILGDWVCEVKKYENGKKRGKAVLYFAKPTLHQIENELRMYGLIKERE